MFIKDHCTKEEVDAILITLNAKKAFDWVSQEYTETIFKTLALAYNKSIVLRLFTTKSAKILINSHLSDSIDIE